MSHSENITRIKAVYNALAELRDQVVFVGGATVSLYSDRPGFDFRPTEDVDIVIELLNLSGYAELETKLRSIGFVNDQESKIICRFKINGIIVDFMPTKGDILNFSNQWYPEGYKNAILYPIDELHKVKIFTAPYFLASKLDAFNNRGKHDGRTSSDFEDIVSILERRTSIWEEINSSPDSVRLYIVDKFKSLLENIFLEEWINAHIDFVSPPSTYFIIKNIRKLVGN
jgi:predicted nucleotidyltransferase